MNIIINYFVILSRENMEQVLQYNFFSAVCSGRLGKSSGGGTVCIFIRIPVQLYRDYTSI